MVGRELPSNCTTDPLMNPDPLTVRVNEPPNTRTGFGEMLEIEGAGLLTARVRDAEFPPPGAGLDTVTDRLAATVRSDDRIAAVS